MKKALLLPALSLLFVATVNAQTPPQYRVLIPVYFPEPVPGAFGSQWKTAWAVHNPTQAQFHIDWCPGSTNPLFNGCTRPLLANAHLAPSDTETTLPEFSHDFDVLNDSGGPRLIYIRPFLQNTVSPSALTFALRAFDVARTVTNAGTETPVVREEQFRKTTTNLLNVPTDPAFRLTLRMYETKLKTAEFTVRVYDQANNVLLGESNVRLTFRFPHHYVSMFEPPYLQIGDIASLLPSGTTLPPALRIEVEPRSEGSEFWAFVSITNNETQHLTLVTPQ